MRLTYITHKTPHNASHMFAIMDHQDTNINDDKKEVLTRNVDY
jgi:hypothetical protein